MNTFSQNDKKLRGTTGAVTVLHTHNRRLDFHPHVHLVMPAVAFDARQRLWRNKNSGYLFCHKALAKVFRAKILGGIKQARLKLPGQYPDQAASSSELHMLRQADADCAHTSEVRGECITQPGADSGDGHVKQHIPQACCNQQVRFGSTHPKIG